MANNEETQKLSDNDYGYDMTMIMMEIMCYTHLQQYGEKQRISDTEQE